MEPTVAAAVLGAALLHATWQALVKSSGDGLIALAGMNLVSTAAALAALPFVSLPTPAAALVIAVSVVLHGGYKIALAHLYARADLSVGYPLARGLTPIFAALLGFVFLAEVPRPATILGILAISAGITLIVIRWVSAAALAAAVVVGTSVAAYSALDAYGVRINGDWLGFTAWLVLLDGVAFMGYAVAMRRGAAPAKWRSAWGRTLVSGLLGLVSFTVFLWALAHAEVGAVSALRETSIVFSAVLGGAMLRERITAARAASIAMVTVGAAIMTLGIPM